MAKLKDIAVAAGVSIDTVSRVLNGKTKGHWARSAESAARIREIAKKLNYSPDKAARMMRTKRVHQIGILVNGLYNPYTGAVVDALGEELGKHGYGLLLGLLQGQQHEMIEQLRLFAQNLQDGIINLVPDIEVEHIKHIAPRLPSITFNRPGKDSPAVFDMRKGIYLAMNYLWELGHRKIALVAPLDHTYGIASRFSAYEAFYASRSSALDPSWAVVAEGWKREDGIAASKVLQKTGCSACVAGNDLLAVGICAGLQENGIVIPSDFSLVSIDDTLLTIVNRPSLTSINYPISDIAEITVKSLLDLIDCNKLSKQVVLSPNLIERQSTAKTA